MAERIEVISKIVDARATSLAKKFTAQKFAVKSVAIADIYTIDSSLKRTQLSQIQEMFVNPVTQQLLTLQELHFDYAIEIGFLPGVTDNVASTAREMIEDFLKVKFSLHDGVYTSQVIFISGNISKEDTGRIAHSLYNPVIQRASTKSYSKYLRDRGMDRIVPRVKLTATQKVDSVDLHISDEELVRLGKSGIPDADGTRRGPLALDLLYLKTIRAYFDTKKRNPTDLELESLAQTWSEHCKHTIFADPIDDLKDGLYKTYIKKATSDIRKKLGRGDFCVSIFTDNSGAIEFDKDFLVTHKVETHNSPSALDPFGGSITGIVGVNRDAIGFGLGAKPIANTYGFCFAPPDDNTLLYKGPNKTQPMLSPRRIMDGVIAGVNSGGNCSGIPTPQGFLNFDVRFKGKPLVFVGTVGIIPKKNKGKKMYVKKARPGDYIVIVGGRVGLDGIHGATFSSEAMDSGSPATAVQIGDPITQKKLSDALVKEARNLGLYNSITDNGAGGLSCSVAEMAKESRGCEVRLNKVPVKYPGLAPWQIWISESQERMTLAVPKRKWKKFAELMKRRGVEATVIGEFTHSGKCSVYYHKEKIMDMDMNFLHNGLPRRKLTTTFTQVKHSEPQLATSENLNNSLLKILARPNITSFEFISTQYDHEVQGTSIIKPLQGRGRVNGDASVMRPLLSSNKGLVISQGLYPSYSDIDTYHMVAAAIDTAVRNCVAAGADPARIALLDNFCWCSSTDPERLGQLKRAVKACYDIATVYETPFISGKDSMFNDFKGYDDQGNPLIISVPPTLLISAVGIINDIVQAVSLDVKFPGDLLYVIGETHEELGASEYFYLLDHDRGIDIGNSVPHVDAYKNTKIYRAFHSCVRKGLITSAQSVGRAGLGVAILKMAMGGLLGINIELNKLPGSFSRDDFVLFSESQGRIVLSIAPQNKKEFEKTMSGIPYGLLGIVTADQKVVIKGIKGKKIVNMDMDTVLEAYKQTFKDY